MPDLRSLADRDAFVDGRQRVHERRALCCRCSGLRRRHDVRHAHAGTTFKRTLTGLKDRKDVQPFRTVCPGLAASFYGIKKMLALVTKRLAFDELDALANRLARLGLAVDPVD